MDEVSIVGLDLAKRVFQAHGASSSGDAIFRRKLSRSQVLPFLARQPRCIVAMEACASAHFWGRAIKELGHEVRLIPPIYVKPFVKLGRVPARGVGFEGSEADRTRAHR